MVLVTLLGCTSNTTTVVSKVTSPSHSQHGLSKYIKFLHKPDKVSWVVYLKNKESRLISASSPSTYSLIALLDYNESVLNQIKSDSTLQVRKDAIYLDSIATFPWIKKSLKKSLVKDGSYFRVKTTVYDILPISRASYQKGYFFLTEDSKMFVFISTN